MSSKAAKGKRRLFFALWPDDATRVAIRHATREAVRRAGGRAIPPENYHLTLAFLGAQPESRLSAILRVAGDIQPPRGELRLEHLGHFARARVLWLGPARTPESLRDFARALWDGLEPIGIARERRPFAAHLTLARKANRLPNMSVCPLEWRYRGFALIESVTDPRGARYEILAEWPAVK
jgi:2'-5' RNA ligase